MQVIILQKTDIHSSKTNKDYTILHLLTDNGETIQQIGEKSVFDSYGITEKDMPTKDDIDKIFATLPVVDVVYNNRGRIDTIKL